MSRLVSRLLHSVKNIFRPSNLGMFVFFIINGGLIIALVKEFSSDASFTSNLLVVMGLFVLSNLIAFSPLGQEILCLTNGARKMKRRDMRTRVLAVVDEVYRKAKEETPDLPDKIRVRIMYTPEINAFAIGSNTICVTEGFLELPEDLMAGIIAHEMGHLALQHTVAMTIIGGGNIIFSGLMVILQLIQLVLSALAIESSRHEEGGVGCAIAIASAICAGYIFLWTKLCMLVLLGSSRANEYAADKYAASIGYGNELAEALDRLTLGEPQTSFLKTLNSSHPIPGERIAKLQSYEGVAYSRY